MGVKETYYAWDTRRAEPMT